MISKILIFTASILLLLFGFYLAVVTPAYAIDVPSFAVCTNPQGTVKVSYPSGIHGIVGRTDTFNGSDTVYSLSENTLTQCFCAVDGRGIQTNWWKVSSLTQDEIDTLINQGWVFIPNGALWGLDEASYLAINSDYNCQTSSSNPLTPASTTLSTDVGQVLGLASTGNGFLPYILIGTSLVSLFLALLLRKKTI